MQLKKISTLIVNLFYKLYSHSYLSILLIHPLDDHRKRGQHSHGTDVLINKTSRKPQKCYNFPSLFSITRKEFEKLDHLQCSLSPAFETTHSDGERHNLEDKLEKSFIKCIPLLLLVWITSIDSFSHFFFHVVIVFLIYPYPRAMK